MAAPNPYFGFFPALPLARNVEISEWVIGSPPRGTHWVDDGFRKLALALLAKFERRGFKSGAMLWHRDRGFDGVPPPQETARDMQAAIGFALLDANDRLGESDKGHNLATWENAEIQIHPIDVAAGSVVYELGGALRRTQVIMPKHLRRMAPPIADAALPIARPVSISGRLTLAMFEAISAGPAYKPHVRIAAEWHRTAMSNPNAVTFQQRIIALKTGFEALLGTSKSWECASLLHKLFQDKTAAHRDLLPTSSVLWSPKERTDLARTYKDHGRDVPCRRSEVEDWFMALADARNSIIHDGKLDVVEYACRERPLSPYNGGLFWKAERMLREAIKASLGPEILLCAPLARRAVGQALYEEMRQAVTSATSASPDSESVPSSASADEAAEEPARDLPTLLAALHVPAANFVQISKLHGFGSASLEVAIESERRSRNKWAAEAGPCTMMISRTERDLLLGADAEDEIPEDDWVTCD